MSIQEIKDTGLLELYVLNQLSKADIKRVEGWIQTHPEIKKEIVEIEITLEKYAQGMAIEAPISVKNEVLAQIRNESPNAHESKGNGTGFFKILAGLLLAALAAGMFFLGQKTKQVEQLQLRYQTLIDSCAEAANQHNNYIAQLELLSDPATTPIKIAAQEKYAQTDLYLYKNDEAKRNFIQAKRLATISVNESYQLWSLKDPNVPTPLDVFQNLDVDSIIEVAYDQGSPTYAITVEPLGGSQSPNLDNLVGVLDASGD